MAQITCMVVQTGQEQTGPKKPPCLNNGDWNSKPCTFNIAIDIDPIVLGKPNITQNTDFFLHI